MPNTKCGALKIDRIGGLKSNAAKITKAAKRSVYLLDLFMSVFGLSSSRPVN